MLSFRFSSCNIFFILCVWLWLYCCVLPQPPRFDGKNLRSQIIQRTFLIETMVTNVGYTNNYILSLLMCALLAIGVLFHFILFHFIPFRIIFIARYSQILITNRGGALRLFGVVVYVFDMVRLLFTCKNSTVNRQTNINNSNFAENVYSFSFAQQKKIYIYIYKFAFVSSHPA